MDEEETQMHSKLSSAVSIIESCKEFASTIPEVRSNFVYVKMNAKKPTDVLAVDGRITSVEGMPHASGKLKWGASSHMARFLIDFHKHDSNIRCGINFSNYPAFVKWLEKYCEKKGWVLELSDRSHEPEEIKEKEGASIPWEVEQIMKRTGGKVPKIIYENEAMGKEPVSLILGHDPVEVAKEMCELAKEYISSWTKR